ncbi:hypothetical protein PINS_up003823 [Pythium insidiosum]|nr:hypothetical protein PINS_up003823 [Pythium insidiosum]
MPGSLFDMVLIPMEIVLALTLLAHEVRYAFVGGVIVLATMLPIQTFLGGKIQAVTKSMLAFRDDRVNVTAECLRAMRPIKLMGWIDTFALRIDMFRQSEMGRLTVRKYLDAFCVFFWASTPVIVQTSVFVTVIYTGHDLSAANAFTAVSLLDRLIYPMNYFPWIINGFLEARVSALRIRDFLLSENNEETPNTSWDTPPQASTRASQIAFEMENAVFTWGDSKTQPPPEQADLVSTPLISTSSTIASNRFTLSLPRFNCGMGDVHVICGPVGAGKTSLLLALLGEMPLQQGVFWRSRSHISYAPQSAWLFRGTVRENITMNHLGANTDVDDERLRKVLHICDLTPDLRAHNGDNAVIAENGANFSGGQRARIGLARALYQQADVYLLDDPLSSLDAKTARRVLQRCFASTDGERVFPPEATVVIATHDVHLLEDIRGDCFVTVLSDGQAVQQGSLSTLKTDTSGLFSAMVKAASAHVKGNLDGGNDTNTPLESDVSTPLHTEEDREGEADVDDEEHRESGVVQSHVWHRYASAIGWPLSLAVLLAVTVMQVSRNGLDWWIAYYTNAHSVSPRYFADALIWITLVNCVAVFFRSFLFAIGGLQAANTLYKCLIQSILHAPLAFFDTTPVGRILNRLSGDTYGVDESLPFILNIFLKDFADVVGSLAIIFIGNRYVLFLLLPLSVIYYRLQRDYRPTSRHVKRLESTTQSPILGMFTETMDGVVVIRAMGLEAAYSTLYQRRLNLSQRSTFLSANAGSWFGLRLDLLGVIVTSFVVVFAVVEYQFTNVVHPGILGLTLTYALPIVSKLNTILGSFVDTERQMIAVERVKEYADLPREETAPNGNVIPALPSLWPNRGAIQIERLSVLYSRNSSAGRVEGLRDVSCAFAAGEKVGICGRTGAGKTSLLRAIFRAAPWSCGSAIHIDGIPIDRLPLSVLRASLTYVPQEVILFAGTVRFNLDPVGSSTDEAMWESLRHCGLDTVVAKLPGGLDATVEAGDATFSKGQTQVLCVARALLRRSKVLCVDEATSSVDYATEVAVSKALLQVFADSTVLIVAHRLNTVMTCDHVIVLDEGRVVEFGKPGELMEIPTSHFYQLAKSQDVANQ